MSSQPRPVSRRAVVLGGGAVGVAGVLAACGGGDAAPASPSASTPASTPAPASSPATSTGGSSPSGARVAAVADIPVEGGRVIEDPAVVITQPSAGEIKAFTSICPHQGCPVTEVVANEIACPCHGSLFSAVDGSVIQGPALEALAAAPVSVVDGEIYIG